MTILSIALIAGPLMTPPAFPQFSPINELTVSFQAPSATVAADFDGDGDLDLAVLQEDEQALVWLRNDGLGNTVESIEVSELFEDSDFKAADLDGDGDVDLASVDRLGRALWHENTGLGLTWISHSILPNVPQDASSVPIPSIELADLSGDGILDIAYGKGRAGSGVLTRVAVGQGGGQYAAGVPLLGPGVIGGHLLADDMDGDGDLDIVTIEYVENLVRVSRNDGSIPFSFSTVIRDGGFDAGPTDVVTADLNQDGDRDVVVAMRFGDRIERLLNEGSLVFSAPAGTPISENDVICLDVGDVNGDGVDDIVSGALNGDRRVSLFLGDGAGDLVRAAPVLSEGIAIPSVELADMDGDGDQDVVAVSRSVDLSWSPNLNTPSGAFGPPETLLQLIPRALGVEMLDLDADGATDIVVASRDADRLLWYPGNGEGAFGTRRLHDIPVPPVLGMAMGDADGDGDQDLFLATTSAALDVSMMENLGGGNWAAPVPFDAAGGFFRDVEFVDLNGDGLLDFVSASLGALGVRLGTTSGFAPPLTIDTFSAGYLTVDAGDIDGDGQPDLVASRRDFGEPPMWFRNLGGGAFAPGASFAGATGFTDSIELVDADGDGDLDVIRDNGGSGNGHRLVWDENVGGAFGPTRTIGSVHIDVNLVGQEDLDQDGRPEVIGSYRTIADNWRLVYFPNLSGGAFGQEVEVEFGFAPDLMAFGDLDCDGDRDMACLSTLEDRVGWFESQVLGVVGLPFCEPAAINSTGRPGRMNVLGADEVSVNQITLRASDLPVQTVGIFVTSQTQMPATPVVGSSGNLCLGGSIGRFVGPGQVVTSQGIGLFCLPIDLALLPTPQGLVQAQPGETWSFQAWFRDTENGAPTSNFTHGAAVILR